jgi:hypothetical protein
LIQSLGNHFWSSAVRSSRITALPFLRPLPRHCFFFFGDVGIDVSEMGFPENDDPPAELPENTPSSSSS